MNKTIFILLLTMSSVCLAELKSVTWLNRGWTYHDDSKWHLSIHERDLPDDNLCLFGQRKFEPEIAITESTCWLKNSGIDEESLHVESVEIYKLGTEWKKCVYVVNFRGNDPKKPYGMHIGVDFNGRVHAPMKHPITVEKVNNKKIEKCSK